MIDIYDFIFKSEIDKPRTATYGEYKLVSKGEGENRYMYIMKNDVEVGYFWVDAHFWYGANVRSIRGDMRMEIHYILEKYAWHIGLGYEFYDLHDLEKVITDLIEILKWRSKKD